MKKTLYHVISLILVLTLVISAVPAAAFADNSYDYDTILQITAKTTLRAEPLKDSKAVAQVSKGGYLTCTGEVTNKYGNKWYKVQYGKQEAYIYTENVSKHTHSMHPEGDTNILLCDCGYYEIKDNCEGVMRMNAATLVSGSLLGPAVVEAAGSLSAIIGAAVPYLAIISVGGFFLYVAITRDATKAEVRSVVKNTSEYENSNFEDGKYYYTIRNEDVLLFAANNPINVNEAADFLRMVCTATLPFMNEDANVLRNIYTPLKPDAEKLVAELENTKTIKIRCIQEDAHKVWYFNHYNIECGWGLNMRRVNAHIFYESPVSMPNVAAA